MIPKELLVKITKTLIDSGASTRTVGIIIGALSPSFVKENYVVPRANISKFVEACSFKVTNQDLPILDLGCGRRNHRTTFAKGLNLPESDIPYIAIDHFIGNDQLYTEGGPNIVGNVSSVPIVGMGVGVAICTEVLEHVPDDEQALREMYRVLRPGGKLFLSIPGKYIPRHEKLPYQKDYRRYSAEELHEKLSNSGFKEIKVSDQSLYGMQVNIYAEASK